MSEAVAPPGLVMPTQTQASPKRLPAVARRPHAHAPKVATTLRPSPCDVPLRLHLLLAQHTLATHTACADTPKVTTALQPL